MNENLDQSWRRLLRTVRPLQRNNLEFLLPYEKKDLALAAVCFQDTKTVLAGSHFAYLEFQRLRAKFKAEGTPMEEAVFFERFYLDDLLIRLYPAGEHLADAIFYMLELKEEDLKPHRPDRVSRQAAIGNYLHNQKPDHPVTCTVERLMDSAAWRDAKDYRGDWVHGQPPTVEGTGIIHGRKSGWEQTESGPRVTLLGAGDPPRYNVNDILAFAGPALSLFIEVVTECMGLYVAVLGGLNITVSVDAPSE